MLAVCLLTTTSHLKLLACHIEEFMDLCPRRAKLESKYIPLYESAQEVNNNIIIYKADTDLMRPYDE